MRMAVPMTEAHEVVDVDLDRAVIVLANGDELEVEGWFDEDGEEVPAGMATQAIANGFDSAWWVDLYHEGPLQ
jgi:hypothetical protein